MKTSTLFLIFGLFVLVGCNRSQAYLKDLDKFVSKVEANYMDFDDTEWAAIDKKFTELSETRFEKVRKHLSENEIKRANELIGKYQAIKIKKGFGDFKSGIKDLFQQGKEAVKGLLPDSAKVRDAIDRGKSEIKELMTDSVK